MFFFLKNPSPPNSPCLPAPPPHPPQPKSGAPYSSWIDIPLPPSPSSPKKNFFFFSKFPYLHIIHTYPVLTPLKNSKICFHQTSAFFFFFPPTNPSAPCPLPWQITIIYQTPFLINNFLKRTPFHYKKNFFGP